MAHPFRYVAPGPAAVNTMEALALEFEALYELMLGSVVPSAETTLAIRKLQEARMWINAAILGVSIR